MLPPSRSFSQGATSFIASRCQGIHQMPLDACSKSVARRDKPQPNDGLRLFCRDRPRRALVIAGLRSLSSTISVKTPSRHNTHPFDRRRTVDSREPRVATLRLLQGVSRVIAPEDFRNNGVETPDQNLFTMRKNHSGPTLSVPEDEFLCDPLEGAARWWS